MKHLKNFKQINEDLSEKFSTQFIKPDDKVITISDTSEIEDAIKNGDKIRTLILLLKIVR